jgi:hypothetical protein
MNNVFNLMSDELWNEPTPRAYPEALTEHVREGVTITYGRDSLAILYEGSDYHYPEDSAAVLRRVLRGVLTELAYTTGASNAKLRKALAALEDL